MKRIMLSLAAAIAVTVSFAQKNINELLNVKEAERIERILSADNMEGRKVFTPAIDRAAAFIADEFKKTGLQTLNNNGSFLQPFALVKAKFISVSGVLDGAPVDAKSIVVITTQPYIKMDEKSGYEKTTIAKGKRLTTELRKLIAADKNYFVLVDTSLSGSISQLTRLKSQLSKTDKSIVLVFTALDPVTFSVEARHEITEQPLTNVVGVLPGKNKKNEYVIFSSHYDHLGIMSKDKDGNTVTDSIFNGANDDAAGTTAVIMLARYFKALNNNERTLVFVTFTAEELGGGIGSKYFSSKFNAADVKAMFNIEMIGTESKWGKNSAYITGYEKTDMGKILQANLEGTDFTFYPDPYTAQNLFFRSDNASLAAQGVPAHTISTSKMDNEPYYHKASDEITTLDLDNMVMIMKAIALSSRGIVSGKETPSRVDVSQLTDPRQR